MVSYRILALFAVACFAASVNAAPSDEEFDVDAVSDLQFGEVERGFFKEGVKAIAKEALQYFKEKAKKVNYACVGEVIDACTDIKFLRHPIKYTKCAYKYVEDNLEHCYHSEGQNEENTEA